MIQINKEPWCDECPDFYATSDTLQLNATGEETRTVTIIRCANLPQCRRIEQRLKTEREKDK